jgi:Cation transporter/ATPase, N-terminus
VRPRLTGAPGPELEPQAGGRAWHTLSVGRVLRAEEVDAQRGLSSAEAAARAGRFGPNMLAAGRAEPGWLAFIRALTPPRESRTGS